MNPHTYHPVEELTTVKSFEVKELMKVTFVTCEWKREMGGQGPSEGVSACAALPPTEPEPWRLARVRRCCQSDVTRFPRARERVKTPPEMLVHGLGVGHTGLNKTYY